MEIQVQNTPQALTFLHLTDIIKLAFRSDPTFSTLNILRIELTCVPFWDKDRCRSYLLASRMINRFLIQYIASPIRDKLCHVLSVLRTLRKENTFFWSNKRDFCFQTNIGHPRSELCKARLSARKSCL